MQRTTFQYTPNEVSPPRARRNTMESPPRQPPMIKLVRASQQQQYAYQYMDDRASFMRAQKEEEERIQQDMERAQRAQRRNKARKVARAPRVSFHPAPLGEWHQGGNSSRSVGEREKSRLEQFKFPRTEPAPTKASIPSAPPAAKRLAPLPPFNPYVRARSESLSSLIENKPPAARDTKTWKRNASISVLFGRIHREAGIACGGRVNM